MSYYLASCGHPVPITCRECENRPPEVADSQLAVLLRQTQWALDDAAHDFPGGRATPQRREELAATLETLAAMVRASLPIDLPTGRPSTLGGCSGHSLARPLPDDHSPDRRPGEAGSAPPIPGA